MIIQIPGDLAVSHDFFEEGREQLEEEFGVGIDTGPGGVVEVSGPEEAMTSFLEAHGMSLDQVEVIEAGGGESEVCPECSAPLGAPHDPGCPNADPFAEPDPDRYREGAGFDKFMDRIVIQERRTTKVDGKENNPARLIAGKYQERPLGRIRYGVKR